MADRNVKDSTELLDRAREGDEGAFSELVRDHQHEVFTLAFRLLGNYELAADAAQETFIRAWRALPRFRGDSALSTWLHRITVNTSWTLGRRAQRHNASTLDEALLMDDSSAPSPESSAEMAELGGRLRSAVAELPDPQRAVVVLKDIYGWSHAEVAKALDISVTAAKVRLHRARQKLKEKLWREME
jgi:RNA polymerase sigma-70 factor (ECF subfamily)